MRSTWDQTWMDVADVIARRSDCERAQCGAVIVSATNRIVATGYNGAPAGYPGSCFTSCDRAHKTEDFSPCYADCISIHAETNALLFCDRLACQDGVMYVNTNVCMNCAKLVANSGLARVVMRVDVEYRNPQAVLTFLAQCGMVVELWAT